jgi:hypothetical protein
LSNPVFILTLTIVYQKLRPKGRFFKLGQTVLTNAPDLDVFFSKIKTYADLSDEAKDKWSNLLK